MKSPAAIVLAVLMFLSGSTVLAATVMKFVNDDDEGMVRLMSIQQMVSSTAFTVFMFALIVVLMRGKGKK